MNIERLKKHPLRHHLVSWLNDESLIEVYKTSIREVIFYSLKTTKRGANWHGKVREWNLLEDEYISRGYSPVDIHEDSKLVINALCKVKNESPVFEEKELYGIKRDSEEAIRFSNMYYDEVKIKAPYLRFFSSLIE